MLKLPIDRRATVGFLFSVKRSVNGSIHCVWFLFQGLFCFPGMNTSPRQILKRPLGVILDRLALYICIYGIYLKTAPFISLFYLYYGYPPSLKVVAI